MDDLNGPEQWFRSLPVVTRYWFAAALMCTCCGNFGVVSIMKLAFFWEPLKSNFEVWRLVTPFCYVGKFDLSTLFGLYMLQQYSRQYESGGPYNTGAGGGTADYVFCLMFGCSCILLSYPLLSGFIPPIFCRNLTFFVLYVWSKRYPEVQVNIWGVPLKALWLPFALLALTLLMGNPYFDVLHGIAVGHAYYFLVDVVPLVYGKDVLHTPQFLIDYFGVGEYVPPVPNARTTGQGNNTWAAPGRVNPPANPTSTGHNWGGAGRTLGTS